eukprot:CCRYP_019402-RA/>CCRYP_019402-RA protein AED:0.17 eAED:0.17 QI:0/0.5/0.33/0.66/0/0.33/3/1545/202
MEFLEELINDFVGWVSSPTVEDTGNNSISAGSAVTRRGLSYSSVASSSRASQAQDGPQHLFDLTTEDGREEFFHLVAPMSLTKKRMGGAYFSCRFDGQFHHSLPVKQIEAYCQYCRYKFTYQMTERERANNPGMKKNRSPAFSVAALKSLSKSFETDKMSWLGDKAEEAVEKKIFDEGGYPALFKYKAAKTWHKISSCSCCS